MRKIKNVELLLKAATFMHGEGKLSNDEFKSIVEDLENYYRKPELFWPDIAKWIKSVLSIDSPTGHLDKIQLLVDSFMESSGAHSELTRAELLLLGNQLKALFLNLNDFEPSEINNQLNRM